MKRIWLRDARLKAGFTQAELAAQVGKPQSFVSKIERGENADPSFNEVVALARVLNIDPLALRFGRRVVAA